MNGKIQVTADPSATLSANKSRSPKLLATGSDVPAGQGKGVVIVGGGSGAFNCIESLREVSACEMLLLCSYLTLLRPKHGYKGPITLLSKEPYAPIDRCVTSCDSGAISDGLACIEQN